MGILETLQDCTDWEKLRRHCEATEGFSDSERQSILKALKFLESELGTSFLRAALAKRHPIILRISNQAPWTFKWVVWFAEAIKESQAWEGSASLLQRLRGPKNFEEGLSVLEAAYRFSLAGFRVFIDPSVEVRGRKKMPDLILVVENTSLFSHAQDVDVIVSELQQEVRRHPHLLLMDLRGAGFGKGEDIVVKQNSHLLVQRSRFGVMVEQQIILLNGLCKFQVRPATIDRLQAAFRDY